MNEIRIWLGREGYFKPECEALIQVLKSLSEEDLAVSLQVEENIGYQWILNGNLTRFSSPLPPGEIILFTSGTTGLPKPIRKNWREILRTRRGNGSYKDKWLLTFSPTRWAGLSVISHCYKNASELIIPNSLTPVGVADALKGVTHIALTPSMFRKLLIAGVDLRNDGMKQVTFGGESCSQHVLDQAKEIWPFARISHIYAAAEFGDLACSSDGKEGFHNLPGELLEDGELIVYGRSTGDLWENLNSRWYFRGRKQETANVGGAKVNLFEVENVLNRIEGVFQCRIFVESSAILGQLVCAEYVGSASEQELTRVLRGLLPKYAVPKLTKVEVIELSNAGKIKRL